MGAAPNGRPAATTTNGADCMAWLDLGLSLFTKFWEVRAAEPRPVCLRKRKKEFQCLSPARPRGLLSVKHCCQK